MCRKGIRNRKARIKDLIEQRTYVIESNAFVDKWANYLARRDAKKEERDKKEQEVMKDELAKSIEFEKNALKAEQDQLKNGVEVKEIKTPEMVK